LRYRRKKADVKAGGPWGFHAAGGLTSPRLDDAAERGLKGLVAGTNSGRASLFPRRGAQMSEREIYHSENGDRWFLCREDERVFVLHKANVSSGGTATKIELGDFLGRGKAGPEHQALSRLIGRLVD
jgi:hypothetical protein